jgi:exodeoxyribonuclease VII large subunit
MSMIPEAEHILSVSELTRQVKSRLELSFQGIWLTGEISNFRMPQSGHFYFTLKDESAQIRAVMFRFASRSIKFRPEDGQSVTVYGSLGVYEPRGEYQIIIEYMEARGVGNLLLAFEQLKQKLAAEGLFDPKHKKPRPFLPRRIGLITSPTGAALRDILTILGRRFPTIAILILPVAVQGEKAAPEIAAAIRQAQRIDDLDLLIVGRGGGSIEDLWPFNEEIVARAIFASRIPLISAVGHETDFSIADFVADLRAPTPSAAAELAVPVKADLQASLTLLRHHLAQAMQSRIQLMAQHLSHLRLPDPRRAIGSTQQHLDDLFERLIRAMTRNLQQSEQSLSMRRARLVARHPRQSLGQQRLKLEELRQRLIKAGHDHLRRQGQALTGQTQKLQALSPLAVLERGYAIAMTSPDGRIVKAADMAPPGTTMEIRLHQGRLICNVQSNHPLLEEK